MNAPVKPPSIGHNSGKAVGNAQAAIDALNAWLKDTPAVSQETEAHAGGRLVKDAKSALKGMDAERRSRVDPLNEQVRSVNGEYAAPKSTVEKLISDVERRLTAYALAEERRRAEEAEAKRRIAEEAERAARVAEEAEREARENASLGEIGVDVGGTTQAADEAFAKAQAADRDARRSLRDMPVRLASEAGSRALSLRSNEVLTVADPHAAIREMGLTDKIRDAILSSAREHRKSWGGLPAGITTRIERSL